jgi:ubiquitin C-terminal hydrolase
VVLWGLPWAVTGIELMQGRTAEGGHYVAWIKKSTGQWYKFDDDKVPHAGPER